VGGTIGGFANPPFFTATAMIGMIALPASSSEPIILIDFVRARTADGMPLEEAIAQSGAMRARPIALTAGAAMLGAWPITLDPIFSGLAWALVFGLLASTAFTLVVVPVAYYALTAPRAPS
jgi:multidrug efflux pump subunit AcrB